MDLLIELERYVVRNGIDKNTTVSELIEILANEEDE